MSGLFDNIDEGENSNDLFEGGQGKNSNGLFGGGQDDDEELAPLNTKELLASPFDPLLNPSQPSALINGDGEEDFEVIEPHQVPPPEEAERELKEIEAERQRRLEEEKEKEEQEDGKEEEEEEEEEEMAAAETTDGGMLTKLIPTRSCIEADTDPLTSSSPPISDPEDGPQDNELKIQQEQIEELKMNLEEYKSEVTSLREKVAALERKLKEEREKSIKLEATLKEKDTEIASLKETVKPPSGRKISGSKSSVVAGGSSASLSVSSPKTSAKLDRKSTASVAETVKKFGGTGDSKPASSSSLKPSPPVKRISVGSKPDKPEKPDKVLQRESSASKLTPSGSSPSSSRSTSAKKERNTSTSSQEGTTTSVAASKREAAEKAAVARTSSQTKSQDISSKPSPPKPQRNRTKQQVTPESSPQMTAVGTRSALDAIKMWEQKSSSTTPEESPKKTALSNQLSAPIIPTPVEEDTKPSPEEEGDKKKEVEERVDASENVPPLASEKKEETEPKVTMREKPVGTRSTTTQSVIVRGGPAGKRWGPVLEKCESCKKTVYQQERLQADGKVFHKVCFRCSHCNKVVGLGNYAAINSEIYCKVHFKMLFKMKGNYDEGFGRSQHKAKWATKTDAEPEPLVATATQ